MNNLIRVFAERIPEKINWDKLSRRYHLDATFMNNYKNKIDIKKREKFLHEEEQRKISRGHQPDQYQNINTKLSKEVISESNLRKLDLKKHMRVIQQFQKLSIPFIKEFEHLIEWEIFSTNKYITEEVVLEFKDQVKIEKLFSSLTRENFTMEFIRKNKMKLSWFYVTLQYLDFDNLAEIEEFKEYILWDKMDLKKLSVNSILLYHKKFTNQKYSNLNIGKFNLDELNRIKHIIDWENHNLYHYFRNEIVDKFVHLVNWKWVSMNVQLTNVQIEKYWNLIEWQYLGRTEYKISYEIANKLFPNILEKFTLSRFPFTIHYNDRKYPIQQHSLNTNLYK